METLVLVMAGGKASRLGGLVKPLLRVCGKTILERVVDAALPLTSRIVVAVAGGHSRLVARRAHELLVDTIYTPGMGYARDLGIALASLRPGPVLVLPADTPFLDTNILYRIIKESTSIDAGVVTVKGCRGYLGVSMFKTRNTGKWADIAIDDCSKLIDIDDFNDLAKALTRCS